MKLFLFLICNSAVALVAQDGADWKKLIAGAVNEGGGLFSVEGEFTSSVFDEKVYGKGERVTTSKYKVIGSAERGGEIRVEHNPLISPWIDGASEFYEEHVTHVFNGNNWIELLSFEGPKGNVIPSEELLIFKANHEAYSSWNYELPIGYLLKNWKLLSSFPFSKPLDGLVSIPGLKVETSKVDGLLTVTFRQSSEGCLFGEDVLIFDISKGPSLVEARQRLNIDNTGRALIEYKFKVNQFTMVGGFNFPVDMAFELHTNGKLYKKGGHKITKVELLGEDFDNSWTKVKAEPGCFVRDSRIGHTFFMGDPQSTEVEKIKRAKSRDE